MLAALAATSACIPEGGPVSRNATDTPEAIAEEKAALRASEAESSPIIAELQQRRSALSGSYEQVADAVLAANARVAEAELRSARLRAVAASKNWLPTIGPSVSLTSLGDFVASLVIEQVLFDNGRKKAERAFAKADVEVAAVTLADDTNDRVHQALSLYLLAEKGREEAALAQTTLKDMQHFEWIMNERVKGGVSDMSDLNVLRQKLAEIRSQLTAANEATETALAELGAMSAKPVTGLRGLSQVKSSSNVTPLSVLLAQAEKEREIAQATIDRAGTLPGLAATGRIGDNSGASVNTTGGGIGLGTGSTLRAIEASKEAASRRVAQAREDANRTLRGLENRSAALARQASEARGMTTNAQTNLDLFQAQYTAGQRQVMDVVGVYETFASQQNRQITLKYDTAQARLDIARHQGVLADGSAM